MKRRGFLQLFGKAAAAVAALPVVGTAVAKPERVVTMGNSMGKTEGFGLAQVKREGSSVAYDANFQKALWPGIKKRFGDEYAKFEPDFKNLFDE